MRDLKTKKVNKPNDLHKYVSLTGKPSWGTADDCSPWSCRSILRPLEDPDARYPISIQQRPDKITVDEKKFYRSHGNLLTSVVNCLLSFELDYGYFVKFSIRSAWKMKSTNIEIAKQLNATGSPKPDIHCMQVRRWWHIRLTIRAWHSHQRYSYCGREGGIFRLSATERFACKIGRLTQCLPTSHQSWRPSQMKLAEVKWNKRLPFHPQLLS